MARGNVRWSTPASYFFEVLHDDKKVGTVNAATIEDATAEAYRRFPPVQQEIAGRGKKYRFHTPVLTVRQRWDVGQGGY